MKRHLKYIVLLAVLALPVAYAHAQVAIGVQIGPSYGLYNAPPVCAYGFYPYYPFACAPYGYWAPDYFVDGVFIGVGPWDNFYYSHPAFYRPFYFNRGFGFHDGFRAFRGDDGFRRFGDNDRFRGEFHGGFRGEDRFRGDEHFRGGEGFRSFRGDDRGLRADNRGHDFRGGEARGFEGGGRSYNGGGRSFNNGGGRSYSGGHGNMNSGGGRSYGGGGHSYSGGGNHNGGGGSHGGGGSSHGGRH